MVDKKDITDEITNEELEQFLDIKLDKKQKDIINSFKKSSKVKKFDAKNIQPVTDKDYEARIYLWMLQGWTHKKIVDELVNNYGIKTSATARRLIRNVNDSYTSVSEQDMDELKSRYLEMYSDLYTRALDKKDLSTARNVLDSVVKLQGLVSKKVEGKVENTYKVDF